MRYDLTDLQIFLALARTLNMPAAAEEVHRTTSAVSLRLKKLEGALGTTLFVREARGLTLTPAGLAMRAHAEGILSAAAKMETALGAFREGERTTLRIASNSSGIQNYLAPAVGSFLADETVRLTFLERKSTETILEVLAGQAELAFCIESAARDHADEVEIIPLTVDRHILVTPPGHPLAASDRADLPTILAYPYIGLVETTPMGHAMRERARALGLTYAPVVEMPSFSLLLEMVLSGAGVAIVPHSALARFPGASGLSVVLIDEPWALRPLVFAHAKSRPLPDAARRFVEHVRASLAKAPAAKR